VNHQDLASPPSPGRSDDGHDEERAAVIISISVIIGVLVGHLAGPEAGCGTGLAVAGVLHRIIQRDS